MRRLGLFLLVAMCLSMWVRADSGYRLVEPDAETFMRAVPGILEQFWEDGQTHQSSFEPRLLKSFELPAAGGGGADLSLKAAILTEFAIRYRDVDLTTVPFDALDTFQGRLDLRRDVLLSFSPRFVSDFDLLKIAVREANITDFSSGHQLGSINITPTHVDFRGDGESEYLLQVYTGSSGYTDHLLAVGDELYHVPVTSLGELPFQIARMIPAGGDIETLVLDDFDGDGGTEWIVQGYGYGNLSACGDLYVVDWQDGELVDRTNVGINNFFHYCHSGDGNSAEFLYTEPDKIQFVETVTDGWACARTRIDTIDLINDRAWRDIDYVDTPFCDLRLAADAFERQSYGQAAQLYERIRPALDGEMSQYVTARLALAYALDGRLERAQAVLNTVESTGQMGDLVMRLSTVSDQSEAMCEAAHEFFAEINETVSFNEPSPYETWTPENFYFGHPPHDPRYNDKLPDPAQAGCRIADSSAPTYTVATVEIPEYPDPLIFLRDDASYMLRDEDHVALLDHIEHYLARDDAELHLPDLLYWRALTYEFMGRTDDALAEYIAIYEAMPNSAWGMLAALHFEPIEGAMFDRAFDPENDHLSRESK